MDNSESSYGDSGYGAYSGYSEASEITDPQLYYSNYQDVSPFAPVIVERTIQTGE